MTAPEPGTTTPTLQQVIDRAIDAALMGVHVALPGKVIKYDADLQEADIELQVLALYETDEGAETTEGYPNLPSVPVQFLRSNTFSFTFPLAEGDRVAVHFASQAIDQWQGSGELAEPTDGRLHALAHAFCVPGLYPTTEGLSGDDANGTDLIIGRIGGDAIRIAPSGITVGAAGATESMVLGDALKAWLEAHTHPTGTGPSGPPVQAPITTILSSKHKVD